MEWLVVLTLVYAVYQRDTVGQLLIGFLMFCVGMLAMLVLLVGLFVYWLLDESLKLLMAWVDRRFNGIFEGF